LCLCFGLLVIFAGIMRLKIGWTGSMHNEFTEENAMNKTKELFE